MIAGYHSRYGTTPTTAATRYLGFMGNAGHSAQGTEYQSTVGGSYTISNLYVRLGGNIGGTTVHVFTLRKNGVDTGLSITTAATGTTYQDTTDSVSVTAGDTLSWGIVTSGAGGSAVLFHVGFDIAGTTASDGAPITSGTGALSATATHYLGIQGSTSDTTINNQQMVIPTAGTIDKGYMWLAGTPGVGKDYTATLVKNSVDTSLVVTVSGTNTTGSDTTNSVSVVAGDLVYWKIVPTGTPTARVGTMGLRWTPTVDGEYPIMFANSTAPTNTAQRWSGSGNSTWTTSAQQRGGPIPTSSYSLKNLYAYVYSAPTTGKSWAMTVQTAASNTTLTATISDSATSASDTTHAPTATAGQIVEMTSVPSGTPTSAALIWGYCTYQTPTYAGGEFGLMMMGIGT